MYPRTLLLLLLLSSALAAVGRRNDDEAAKRTADMSWAANTKSGCAPGVACRALKEGWAAVG